MILSFSTHWSKHMGEWAGQPTHFVEKILKSLPDSDKDFFPEYCGQCGWKGMSSISIGDTCPKCGFHALRYRHEGPFFGENGYYTHLNHKPKLHTLREDPLDRWKVGNLIHFAINNRSPNYFQFAPIGLCSGIQYVTISHGPGGRSVCIGNNPDYSDCVPIYFENDDDDSVHGLKEMEVLAQNDGFESVDQFFAWFNGDFKGKIIHWAELRF